jgi:hypothetical protein
MKDKIVISCDPGVSGYICIIRVADRAVNFIPNDLPVYNLSQELLRYKDQYDILAIGIEKVHAIPGASAGSSFKFGYNFGVVSSLLGTLGSPLYEITPKKWQSFIGLSIPASLKGLPRRKRIKKGVAEIATKLYPKTNVYGIRGGLIDGKSDSLAIAHTVLHKYHLDKL